MLQKQIRIDIIKIQIDMITLNMKTSLSCKFHILNKIKRHKIAIEIFTGIPAPNQQKKKDLGTIFIKQRDFKGPIFNQNRNQFKKRPLF